MGGALTEVVLVPGVSGQIPQEAGERAQLQVVVRAQQVQQHRQHALLLQCHLAQHRRPLQRQGAGGDSEKVRHLFCWRLERQVEAAAHPGISGRDVLQSSGRCFAGRGVDVALVQHAVVETDHLGVPQPFHPSGHPGHLAEGGEVLTLALSEMSTDGDSQRLRSIDKGKGKYA